MVFQLLFVVVLLLEQHNLGLNRDKKIFYWMGKNPVL